MAEWVVELGDGFPEIKKMTELVRCKDCRYWYGDGYCNKWDNGPGHPEVWENDFCSMGERREDETD